MSNKYTNKDIRRFKKAECIGHQPFVRMEKHPGKYGYNCPECGLFMDEMVRLNHLRRIEIERM